jgi:hypothetical protein
LKAWTEVLTPGIRKTIWQPPPIGWLKFNFDAAIRHDKVTAATCCRTDSGDLLFICSKILLVGHSLWGEAQAALLAISSAQDMGCKYVLFEGDALSIVEAFSRKSEDTDWNIRGIIDDAKSLLLSFTAWDFVHINREANYFVHNLASWACASDFDGPISISFIPNLLFVSGDDLDPSVV